MSAHEEVETTLLAWPQTDWEMFGGIKHVWKVGQVLPEPGSDSWIEVVW